MPETLLARLRSFRPVSADVETLIDDSLRDAVLPHLLATPGVSCVYVGRRDVGDAGERMIVSISDRGAATPGDDLSIPPQLSAHLIASPMPTAYYQVAVTVDPGRRQEPYILRIFNGEVRAGELDAYVLDVHNGALVDAATNEGLVRLHLGLRPPDGFMTVSAWTDWDAIEQATGGNFRRPMATRNADRIVAGTATHYELFAKGSCT